MHTRTCAWNEDDMLRVESSRDVTDGQQLLVVTLTQHVQQAITKSTGSLRRPHLQKPLLFIAFLLEHSAEPDDFSHDQNEAAEKAVDAAAPS